MCRHWTLSSPRLLSRGVRATCGALMLLVGAVSVALAVESPDEVNTFIGTQDDGNTFPGASAPFGMIQVSPTAEHWAGWKYDEARIRGFGHSFLSGAGCWEQGGHVSVLPVIGSIGPGKQFDTRRPESFDHRRYAARSTHDGEVGRAGYYRTRLVDYGGIDVEATALTRAAAERYTFAGSAESGHILVNVGQANERHQVVSSDIHVVGDNAVEGSVVTQSFCGGTRYTTWFRLQFNRPFTAKGTWNGAGGVEGSGDSTNTYGLNGAWLTFDLGRDRAVEVVSALSLVDGEGARNNLLAEGHDERGLRSFEQMHGLARARWKQELDLVALDGGNASDRAVFRTAQYHAHLQPLTASDADGRYRGYDNALHSAAGWTYYAYFSLWDTYRAQNQWLALVRPQVARDIAQSLLAIEREGGWLPRWGYANFETNIMTGDPVTPFLVDLWRAGALRLREEDAWHALRRNAFEMPPAASRHAGRSGNVSYLPNGFVQFDKRWPAKGMDADPHYGASATLEYALADCALSQFADALGQTQDASVLRARSQNWKSIWDDTLRDADLGHTGFPRPRIADGSWYGGGDYTPRSEGGFHEGTAWQYQWLAQHDVVGLSQAMGGRDSAVKRLDDFFAYPALQADPAGAARREWVVGPYDYYNQYRYNPNNEADLHAPWMYTLLATPWKTATVVRAAQHLFTEGPAGVTGNDDLGAMSAWYLFSALGIFPAVPGSGQFLLHAPRFPGVTLDLGEASGRLSLRAPGASGGDVQYVSGVRIDGRQHHPVWVDWAQLRAARSIDFDLSTVPPVDGWGTRAADLPVSRCASTSASTP